MLPDKLKQVLHHEGVVAIATQGTNGPHLVNTWNSYVEIEQTNNLLIPAGFMNKTEANISHDNHVLITVGSREVEGQHGPGTGFLVEGTASFVKNGPTFEKMKQRFPWMRAVLQVDVSKATQTL